MNENPPSSVDVRPATQTRLNYLLERLAIKFGPTILVETDDGWKKVVGPPEFISSLNAKGLCRIRIDKNGGIDVAFGTYSGDLPAADRNTINGFPRSELVLKN